MNEHKNVDYQHEIDQLRNRFGFDFVALTNVNSDDGSPTIKWQYASGNLNNRYQRIVLQSGKGVAGAVFKTGKPMLIKNVGREVGFKDLLNYPIIVAERLQSIAAVPLWKENRVAGVLLAGFREGDKFVEQLFEDFQRSIETEFRFFFTKGEVFI